MRVTRSALPPTKRVTAVVGFFIERPVFASAIAIIMLLAGSICYFLLPVSQFPEITPPQVVVSAI
jgi:multidrug efflux pump subunit AcrB